MHKMLIKRDSLNNVNTISKTPMRLVKVRQTFVTHSEQRIRFPIDYYYFNSLKVIFNHSIAFFLSYQFPQQLWNIMLNFQVDLVKKFDKTLFRINSIFTIFVLLPSNTSLYCNI